MQKISPLYANFFIFILITDGITKFLTLRNLMNTSCIYTRRLFFNYKKKANFT